MKLHTLLLASAAALSFGAFASTGAHAETIYTTVGAPTTVTTTSGQEVMHESYSAVGTRKVGLVGYHPYPLQASHVESNTVRVDEPTTVISTGYPAAGIAANSSSSVTTVTRNGQPINYTTGGGQYYTEDGTAFYRNPGLNIAVHQTGAFND